MLSNREERLLGVLWLLLLGERIRRVTVPQLAVVSECIYPILRIRNQTRKVSMVLVGVGGALLWVRCRKVRRLRCR